MAYIKNVWVDQDVERPKTYEVTENADNSITLTESFGVVTEIGTPVNAVNMNHIEDGIANNDTAITALEDSKADKVQLHALKSYEDAGELLTDSEGLADVKSYAHSTFDLSKFTVVGSPTITDDGIASGFSSSNYLTVPALNSFNTFEIKFKFKFSTLSGLQAIFGNGATGDNSHPFGTVIYCWGEGKPYWRISGGGTSILNDTELDYTFVINTDYYIRLSYNGASYKFDVSTNGNNYTNIKTVDSAVKMNVSEPFYFGFIPTTWEGTYISYDLKQFSITVNGVPIFSGNKTGVDTISNYTVVGSPTITSNGVASGFSQNDYLKATNISFGSSVWEIQSSFVFNTSANNQALISGTNNAYAPLLYVSATGMQLNIPSTQGTWGWQLQNASHTFTVGNTYYYKIGWDGTNYYIKVSDDLGSTYTTLQTMSGTAMLGGSGSFDLAIGTNPAQSGRYITGSIDLNTFKIYVNGDLIYQPYFKIPYTLSKTGSKIVDAIYRSRVLLAYSYNGYAPYYLLNQAGTKYCLPQGELYGIIEKTANTKVSKSGDTMTGDLTISHSGAGQITLKDPRFNPTSTTAPSSNDYAGVVYFQGQNSYLTGYIRNRHNTGNWFQTQLGVRRSVGGTDYEGTIVIGIDENGNIAATAPASDVAGTICTTAAISKGSNGYVKLGNGIIIQWGSGQHTAARTDATVTLPTAFSNTNYKVVATSEVGTYDGDISYGNIGAKPKNSTQITVWNERSESYPSTFDYIAIGY